MSQAGRIAADGAAASPADETWTVRRVLDFAIEDFKRREIPTPRLDAELLLADVLGVERVRLVIEPERPLSPEELTAFRKAIVRRRRFEPIAYILGIREFYGLPIRVDARVLVPRPETEVLVDVALARSAHRSLGGEGLDLCTGSGCVAIALGRKRPTWQLTGTDLSADALDVARDNALRLGAMNVAFVEGDLDSGIDAARRFDLITANPPYVTEDEYPALQKDIVDHEPKLALVGGPTGLDVVARIARLAPERLLPGGVVAMEVGFGQAREAARHLTEAGLSDVRIEPDLAGIERVVSACRPAAS